jgi:hypothetical protein
VKTRKGSYKMDDQLLINEVNKEPGKAINEYNALVEDNTSQLTGRAEGLPGAPTEPVVGITATVEKEVGQVWSQHYYNVKVVTNKIQGGFGAKAAR